MVLDCPVRPRAARVCRGREPFGPWSEKGGCRSGAVLLTWEEEGEGDAGDLQKLKKAGQRVLPWNFYRAAWPGWHLHFSPLRVRLLPTGWE